MIYSFGLVRVAAGTNKAKDFSSDFKINPETLEFEELGDIRDHEGFNFEVPSIDEYFPDYKVSIFSLPLSSKGVRLAISRNSSNTSPFASMVLVPLRTYHLHGD